MNEIGDEPDKNEIEKILMAIENMGVVID